MGVAIVVSGPPGSGTSSVAEHVAARSDASAVVAGDAVFAFVAREVLARVDGGTIAYP